ncbi:MAG: hypothetical protein JWP87_4752 [Labilithrix sp.]|nr:hypothetical protein [Labilithrix sp.]
MVMTSAFRTKVVALLFAASCAAPREGVHSATAADAAIASGMAVEELATAKKEQVVLGWKLEVIGDRARFFACSAEDACGERVVEVPAKALLSFKVVGRARPTRDDGTVAEETDVVRVTLAKDTTTSRGGVVADPHRGLTLGGAQAK